MENPTKFILYFYCSLKRLTVNCIGGCHGGYLSAAEGDSDPGGLRRTSTAHAPVSAKSESAADIGGHKVVRVGKMTAVATATVSISSRVLDIDIIPFLVGYLKLSNPVRCGISDAQL